MAMMSYYPIGYLHATIFLLSIYSARSFAQLENTLQPEVTILQGTLLGKTLTTRHGRNISAFVGIPYAQSPIGNLRFASPVAADSWNGTFNASVETNMCPQVIRGVSVGEEDCLYLNAFGPQLPQDTNSSLLPVMVYIHGGGFQGEYPGPSGPEYLLDADIVLVTFRYRIGPLGFLSTGDEVASGNWGLKDQVLALKWVQSNVRYFGGDPDRVTIFGESAGAASVHLLTLSNATIGLFHQYITQSGSALASWAYLPSDACSSRAFELGEYVGCYNYTSESLISCLRTVDFTDIIDTVSRFRVWEFIPEVVWGPTDEPDIGGAILTDSPSNIFAAGKIRDLPWINGVVRDEGLLIGAKFHEDERLLNNFLQDIDTLLPNLLYWTYQPDSGAGWVNATNSYYFNNDLTTNTSLIIKNLTSLIGDVYCLYPAYDALQQHHALAVNPQYVYSFNYRGTNSFSYTFGGSTVNYGVSHADDLIYLFPKESEFSALNETMSQTDYEMIDTMVQLWTSFASNGTPTASALGDETWEPYSTEGNHLRIGNESDVGLEVQYYFLKERREFWASLHAALEK